MAATLPYLASPGSLKTALEKIRTAATPDRVTKDFVTTKLQIKGGTGAAIPPFLKKIGFVAPDGTPTDLYKRFRNQTTAGAAAADGLKIGYRELLAANEYFYELNDKDLLALIVQVTGVEADNATAKFTRSCIKILKSVASFEKGAETEDVSEEPAVPSASIAGSQGERMNQLPLVENTRRLGLNLSYTINLNLPATSDQAVFNAIFRSLKEHLLSGNE